MNESAPAERPPERTAFASGRASAVEPGPRALSDALDPATAESFARLALTNIGREYPAKLDQVLAADASLAPPRALFPVFHGSFDWHSCVHAHWMLARLLRLFPGLPAARDIALLFDRRLQPGNVAAELSYLARPESRAFERPYGWAWLLKLREEIGASSHPRAQAWRDAIDPLADAFAARFLAYLPDAIYPVRHGIHVNSAFALGFALDYARAARADALERLASSKAREWFLHDRDGPASWEPSGIDFLSPCLIEADLMRRVLSRTDFGAWLTALLPGIAQEAPAGLFTPVVVSDRSDGHIVHLDGLNLSRARCWRAIAAALPAGDARIIAAERAAQSHLRAGMRGIASGEYAGDHWLATFAVLAMTDSTEAT